MVYFRRGRDICCMADALCSLLFGFLSGNAVGVIGIDSSSCGV